MPLEDTIERLLVVADRPRPSSRERRSPTRGLADRSHSLDERREQRTGLATRRSDTNLEISAAVDDTALDVRPEVHLAEATRFAHFIV